MAFFIGYIPIYLLERKKVKMEKVLFEKFKVFLNTCEIGSYDLHIEIISKENKILGTTGKLNGLKYRENNLYILMEKGVCFIDLLQIDSIYEHNNWFYIKLKNDLEYRFCETSSL